jgi:hypothetical protein
LRSGTNQVPVVEPKVAEMPRLFRFCCVAGALLLASTPLLDGWSARAIGRFGARFANGAAITAGAELGGIGGNYRIWTFRGKASVPF